MSASNSYRDAHACEGECAKVTDEGHQGTIQRVRVVDPRNGYDWGDFSYCDTAVTLDKEHGFDVSPATPSGGDTA